MDGPPAARDADARGRHRLLAEAFRRLAGLGIDRPETIACQEENARRQLAVAGPVAEAARRDLRPAAATATGAGHRRRHPAAPPPRRPSPPPPARPAPGAAGGAPSACRRAAAVVRVRPSPWRMPRLPCRSRHRRRHAAAVRDVHHPFTASGTDEPPPCRERPGQLQIGHVRRVDLVQRRVARRREVAINRLPITRRDDARLLSAATAPRHQHQSRRWPPRHDS